MISYQKQQEKTIKQIEKDITSRKLKSTLVAMEKDFKKDKKRCLSSVGFINKQLAELITDKMIKPLEKIEPDFYYYPNSSMHLTIKNIRIVAWPPSFTKADIIKADKFFKKIVPKFKAIKFRIKDVIIFPTSLSVMAYCNSDLKKLVICLDKGLKEIGLPDNKKYVSYSVFWGNITFCRFTHQPSLEFIKKAKTLRHLNLGNFVVDKISLITCNSVCAPKTKKIIAKYKLT